MLYSEQERLNNLSADEKHREKVAQIVATAHEFYVNGQFLFAQSIITNYLNRMAIQYIEEALEGHINREFSAQMRQALTDLMEGRAKQAQAKEHHRVPKHVHIIAFPIIQAITSENYAGTDSLPSTESEAEESVS